MELGLQFGWGMMAHSRTLVREWGAGRVILSPRDLDGDQLRRMGREISSLGGDPVLDPQFYLPHSDHERLRSHAYWSDGFEPDHQLLPSEWSKLLSDLGALNREMGTTSLMLPGIMADSPDQLDVWLEQHETMLEEAQRLGLLASRPCHITIALGSAVATHSDSCQRVIEWLEHWDVHSVYLVLEHPGAQYLSDDPIWLANGLDLVGGLRLQGKRVIVGYANQEMLIMAAAGATAIASGTWMNVRSFPPAKFRQMVDDEMRQRKVWYYAPRTMSEYGVLYVDLAAKQGLLDFMRPRPGQENRFSASLFTVAQPSTAGFGEADAFLHYLASLRAQAGALTQATFDATLGAVRTLLQDAEDGYAALSSREIRDPSRSFGPDQIQACRAALASVESGLGPRLRREWKRLRQ
jgi:hypothetical protein